MSTIEIRHFPTVTKDSLFGAPINHPEHWQLFDEHGKRVSAVSYESREEAEAAAAGMRSATNEPPATA